MPNLFDTTWSSGDIVDAANLNSHAQEHSNSLLDIEGGGAVVGGVGRDQPLNVTGSGATVTNDTTNGKIVVDVADTDTQIETQAAGAQQYVNTSALNFDTSTALSVTDNGSGKITISASGGGAAGDPVSFTPGMTQYQPGLSSVEIGRTVLQSGESLVVERIEFRQKGGGSSTNASIDVYDATAATAIGSQTLGGTTKDAGTSGTGNTILFRLSNNTGSAIDAAPQISGRIEGT